MIHELTGDLLLSEANLIAHGVAPGDHFTSGLALALRERWPSMAKDFRHWCLLPYPNGSEWYFPHPLLTLRRVQLPPRKAGSTA